MSELEYHIKFPKTDALFMDNKLTFSINHIRSREVSTLHFIFRAYDMSSNLMYTFVSDRWVIGTQYRHYDTTFIIPQKVAEESVSFDMELVGCGLSSENPLWFNEVMLQEGEYTDYHIPHESVESWSVRFNNNSFANLYGRDGTFLQVIRPQKDLFKTDKLTASRCTVISPHITSESAVDSATSVFLEFINQSEQRIDVLK